MPSNFVGKTYLLLLVAAPCRDASQNLLPGDSTPGDLQLFESQQLPEVFRAPLLSLIFLKFFPISGSSQMLHLSQVVISSLMKSRLSTLLPKVFQKESFLAGASYGPKGTAAKVCSAPQ